MGIAICLKKLEDSDSGKDSPGNLVRDLSILLQTQAQFPAALDTCGLSLTNKDLRLGLLGRALQRSHDRWFVMAVNIDRRSVSTS